MIKKPNLNKLRTFFTSNHFNYVYPLIVFAFDIVIGFDWVECVAMADKMSTVVVATQSPASAQ